MLISSHESQANPINPQGNPQRIPQTLVFRLIPRLVHSICWPSVGQPLGQGTFQPANVGDVVFLHSKTCRVFLSLDGEENFGRLFGTSWYVTVYIHIHDCVCDISQAGPTKTKKHFFIAKSWRLSLAKRTSAFCWFCSQLVCVCVCACLYEEMYIHIYQWKNRSMSSA